MTEGLQQHASRLLANGLRQLVVREDLLQDLEIERQRQQILADPGQEALPILGGGLDISYPIPRLTFKVADGAGQGLRRARRRAEFFLA